LRYEGEAAAAAGLARAGRMPGQPEPVWLAAPAAGEERELAGPDAGAGRMPEPAGAGRASPMVLPVRLSHRVHTSGSAADVWSLLGEPSRWPRFDVAVARVLGASGAVVQGQRLLAVTRGVPLRIPLDVVRVVPHQAVRLRVDAAPGLREGIEYLLVPMLRGGTEVRLTVDLDGPLAGAAAPAAWGSGALSARLLARAAAQVRRARLRAGSRP
jgi:hypothetical protein